MENKEQKWRKIAIGAGIAAGVVLVLLIVLGIARVRERAAYHAEMQRLEDLYASMAAAQDDSETSGKNAEFDMTDEYSYGGNAAANLYMIGHDGKLAKMMGDETVYYYADNSGNLYRKKLSDSEWELIIHKEGAGKDIFNLNVDNIGEKYVYYEYEDRENDLNNGIYRLNVETLEEELLVSDEGQGKPREPRLMCGKLYYLSRGDDKKDSIYCMDLETLSKEMLFEPMEGYSYIYNFSMTGEEIIFTMSDDIFKLTLQGELSTIYNGRTLENMFVCGEYIFLTDSESEYIIPAFKLDFNGNVIETYDMKEMPQALLTSVQGEYLYFFTYVENKKLLRMRMDSGEFEVVLEYPDEMNFDFVNIVDETMLLGFSKSIDGGKLEDLYALPVNSTDMTLEDCVHLCQEFTAK